MNTIHCHEDHGGVKVSVIVDGQGDGAATLFTDNEPTPPCGMAWARLSTEEARAFAGQLLHTVARLQESTAAADSALVLLQQR